jgi:hypothetical protein
MDGGGRVVSQGEGVGALPIHRSTLNSATDQ